MIASSTWQAECLARDGLPEDRIAVVHPAILPSIPTPSDGPSLVAFAGHLSRFKGIHHLISAAGEIADPHRLWVIGEGPERIQLEHAARRLPGTREVRFLGALGQAEFRRAIGAAHVVVVPSLCGETFNQIGAQAAASGQTVIAYDAGGIRDWAERYPNAYLVPAGDRQALTAALRSALQAPTQRGVEVNHFTVERHVDALIEIYRDVLSAGGR